MRGASPHGGTTLIEQLGAALAVEPGRGNQPGIVVQDALNVVLAYIRTTSGSSEPGLDGGRRSSQREIRALDTPLTALLTQRLTQVDPALPTGEAQFAAAADARLIISIALRSLPG